MGEFAVTVQDILNSAIWTALLASMPLLLTALAIGLTIGIIQTATSIQEQTLIFVPKIIGIFVGLIVFGPWIGKQVLDLTIRVLGELERFIQ
jgi:flagellar biosynthetic protein FliQ